MSAPWPVHVPLFTGELFSTWLSRAALAQGCDPMVLTGVLWPRWRAWTRDLDRGVSEDRMDVLAARSGLCRNQLEEATLRPVVRTIAPHFVESKTSWPWVMAQGSRNRRRFGGLQYCPECLVEDPQPYFRRRWRLAWHIGCEQHRCLLADHCGHCRAPVEPHRCRARDEVQTLCPNCRGDLRTVKTAPACTDMLAFQRSADAVLSTGGGTWAGESMEPAAWFGAARRHAGGRIRLLGTDVAPSSLSALPLVLQRPSERVVRLRMAYRGMQGLEKGNVLADAARPAWDGVRGRAFLASGKLPPSPRSPAKVHGDWVRLLRRLRVGLP
ncbi:MAG: TniQ family protein [Methylotenera sp.]|nr:TniQ family protein [Methylotenera sp.]